MRAVTLITTTTILSMITAAGAAHAQTATSRPAAPVYAACGTLNVDADLRITLSAHPQVATRVNFPSPIADVSNSAPSLWDDFTAPTGETSLWVRPKTTTIAGSTAGVSVLTQDGRSYDFVFEISPDVPATSCWAVADTRPIRGAADRLQELETERVALSNERRRLQIEREDQRRRTAALNRQQQATISALSDTAAKQARDAISAFKYSVNTSYSWGYSKVPPPFEISAAFDDGRNTYVRILSDAAGAPAVVAIQGDETMALNYAYDDLTGVYTIQGLHERIELRFAGILARVDRKL
ncbi:hypothetical protein FFK22_019240 [Mycobacterium sp. KBS0706]|uniref:TrbG/VirB9 family P-type conjugative transfer protein n=1 Tax=Mycobacterium sp. KBS0706 TaxID=2578109 RepID=UPI00110FBA58|nr:TrbG/VirB9 family P-type conjugative transfer protein [Mycobacterium sp. KBS0706]TSD87027.1 hypothetical protein FFK22_019240 [Mycobacterium sp. KBS0706]